VPQFDRSQFDRVGVVTTERQYQDFLFVRGVFAGTLSPQPMDSRTDAALERVFLWSAARLTAE
jgi:hypothetical protein